MRAGIIKEILAGRSSFAIRCSLLVWWRSFAPRRTGQSPVTTRTQPMTNREQPPTHGKDRFSHIASKDEAIYSAFSVLHERSTVDNSWPSFSSSLDILRLKDPYEWGRARWR